MSLQSDIAAYNQYIENPAQTIPSDTIRNSLLRLILSTLGGNTNDTQGTLGATSTGTATTAASNIVAANPNRTILYLFNQSQSEKIYLAFDVDAQIDSQTGINNFLAVAQPGETLELTGLIVKSRISCITLSDTATYNFREGAIA